MSDYRTVPAAEMLCALKRENAELKRLIKFCYEKLQDAYDADTDTNAWRIIDSPEKQAILTIIGQTT